MENKRKLVEVVKYYKEFDGKKIKENKVGVEIQDFTDPNLHKKEIEKIISFYKKEFKDLDCVLGMHGPFIDLNPFSPDLDIRRISYKKYVDVLKIATELEMDYIIYHSQLNDGHLEPIMREFVIESNKELFNSLLKDIPEYKGCILIENIFEKSPKILKDLMQAIDLPNVKINLDIGHANLTNTELDHWIGQLKEHINYMHIHTNNGEFDQHKAPSKGQVEKLYSILDKYKINPVLSLEYKKENLKKELKKYR